MKSGVKTGSLLARITGGVLAAAAATAVALAASAVPAAADSGDGIEACNNGEICFTKYSNGVEDPGLSRKDFYYGANHHSNGVHGAYYWWNTVGNYTETTKVMDNGWSIRNRDTACTVYLFDVDAQGKWFVYSSHPKQSNLWIASVDQRNNGHNRCTSASPVNL